MDEYKMVEMPGLYKSGAESILKGQLVYLDDDGLATPCKPMKTAVRRFQSTPTKFTPPRIEIEKTWLEKFWGWLHGA